MAERNSPSLIPDEAVGDKIDSYLGSPLSESDGGSNIDALISGHLERLGRVEAQQFIPNALDTLEHQGRIVEPARVFRVFAEVGFIDDDSANKFVEFLKRRSASELSQLAPEMSNVVFSAALCGRFEAVAPIVNGFVDVLSK